MTPDTTDLALIVAEVSQRLGRRQILSPGELLGSWSSFVDECQEGYEYDYSEYLNDISVRNVLQAVIVDCRVSRRLVSSAWFAGELDVIDLRFKSLVESGPAVRPGDADWWMVKIPGFGGEDFVADTLERFGEVIALVAE
ncbi:hypothetical protein [Streptomyces sp. NBC_01013]|uniref:hypothetical protein n=1 Tax=Streptomyces sp. NBC_01013 TaxID=2903718 RepID=UPI00386C3F60|nr:hypothetical protein OG538_00070 [Streptomyces sp. NBC_01013]WSV65579.1 hypothetical protein OG538_36350 [Streptomyces sp. NBC_01013]